MKVLVVSSKYPPEYAGSGLRAQTTYRRLAYTYGIRYSVLTSSTTYHDTREYTLDGVTVTRIAYRLSKDYGTQHVFGTLYNAFVGCVNYMREARATWQYLRKHHEQFDVIHVFGSSYVTSAAISYVKITRKPIIIELVNLSERLHPREFWLISLFFGFRFPGHARIVCISEQLKQRCLKAGYRKDQIWCRPNPVDEKRFYFDRSIRSRRGDLVAGIGDDDILLLYMAKFRPLKNQLFLLDVLRLLPGNYFLVLVGPLVEQGPLRTIDQHYYKRLCKAIEWDRLQDRVKLIVQFIEDPQRYFQSADVYLMPSLSEACGTPVFEALSCGTPVVVHDIPGVFEGWVRDGVNGFRCPLNPRIWAERITRAYQIDAAKMKCESEKILHTVSSEQIDKHYYELLQSLSVKKEVKE